MMRDKLGLFGVDQKDKFLILDLLTWMHQKKMDYTNTFCHLMNFEIEKNKNFNDDDFVSWKKRWKERLIIENNNPKKYVKLMRNSNPLIIPRNHKVEEVLKEADRGNLKPIDKFLEVIHNPYDEKKEIFEYQIPSTSKEKYQTFCGT